MLSKLLKRTMLCSLLCTFVFVSFDVAAGVVRKGPPDHYNEEEQSQYWAGAVARIAYTYCGYMKDGKKLKNLVYHLKAGKYGWDSWGHLDGYGGNCAEVKSKYIPMFMKAYGKSDSSDSSEDIEERSNKLICQYALKHYETPAIWSTQEASAKSVEEAKRRNYSPEDCTVLFLLSKEQSDAVDRKSLTKLVKIRKLLLDGLISDEEAEEKEKAILGAL